MLQGGVAPREGAVPCPLHPLHPELHPHPPAVPLRLCWLQAGCEESAGRELARDAGPRPGSRVDTAAWTAGSALPSHIQGPQWAQVSGRCVLIPAAQYLSADGQCGVRVPF